MRVDSKNSVLQGRAIAGKYVVFLAWDLVDWSDTGTKGLMGFAVQRTEYGLNNEIVEKYYLKGTKRFPGGDKTISPGTAGSTLENPVQSFQWGDYSAKPGVKYQYLIIPLHGDPRNLTAADTSALSLMVATQQENFGIPDLQNTPVHNVFFNRGVAGSQAYARKFGNVAPDPDDPTSVQMRWLSRNVFESIVGYIGLATDHRYALRGAFYEFHYLPVLQAFRAAVTRGADVSLLYEAQEYKDVNELTISTAAIADVCKPQRVRAGIRHNKFLVLIKDNQAIAVMTGSTNISAGGIFGHSNVLHIIWDREIAAQYLAYWEQLSSPTVETHDLKVFAKKAPEFPPVITNTTCSVLFSPRDGKDDVTLNWYAERFERADRIACMTFAFGLASQFEAVLAQDNKTVRYALFDKAIKKDVAETIQAKSNSVVACGAKLEAGDLEGFIGEHLTGFNKNAYIHDKFLLCDPLGPAPLVVTGSANFSPASQVSNDENMLVIPMDSEVADHYLCEFMRVFDHLYVRYVVGLLKHGGKSDPNAGHLKETPDAWLNGQQDRRKAVRRAAFLA